jgi:F420H(2)-dependent quinone reductase
MSKTTQRRSATRVPPRWFVRLAWQAHRLICRVTGGRLGLWRPKPGGWGTVRLTVEGRRSRQPRKVILGYFEDGPDLVTMAMNGWADGDPAWWLNLQANPEAMVELVGDRRRVRAHRAVGAERDRLWSRWRQIEPNLDDLAGLRSTETAVVVLEPIE